MSSSESEKKMLTLKSSDGAEFEVEESIVTSSQTIKNMIEDDCSQDGIPLPNVTGSILAKVIEYSRKHAESNPLGGFEDRDADEELKKWDEEFVKVDQDVLFDLILAANYLNNKGLLDLTCKTVADMMRGKTPEQIREIFHIKNDYTPEEEEEVCRENAWAFDDLDERTRDALHAYIEVRGVKESLFTFLQAWLYVKDHRNLMRWFRTVGTIINEKPSPAGK